MYFIMCVEIKEMKDEECKLPLKQNQNVLLFFQTQLNFKLLNYLKFMRIFFIECFILNFRDFVYLFVPTSFL